RQEGDRLSIEVRNEKYYYTPRAFAVMLRVVTEFAPEVREIRLIIANDGIPAVSFTCLRDDAVRYKADTLTLGEFLSVSEMNTSIYVGLTGEKSNRQWWNYGLKPDFQTYLESREGYFKYRFGLSGWLSLYPWRGSTFITGLQLYPLNNVPVENIGDSSIQVRGDIALYKSQRAALSVFMAEQIKKFPYEIYGRLGVGLLEVQYGGLDGEVAMPFWGGRLMVGLSGSLVKKRDPDMAFGFKKNDYMSTYQTAFVNTRVNFPEIEAAINLKMGQFLAGDRGTVVTLSKFFNGVILSAWYSITNTDLFTDPFNRGYHDKGIAVSIPIRLFEGADKQTAYNFAISPWTRDVGQDIDHFSTLFDYMGRNVGIY
ncbi:MAG: YjbH domain-containing protein, partial [Syntrophales bacterium LBB04]|nr:YjbH domain-containing protein [Syntrophales bacterium LBB04]